MASHSRLARSASLFLLAIGISVLLVSGNCAATEYSQDVSTGIPALHYWAAPLSLNAGEYVHIQLQVNGAVDFYFMSASDYSRFTSLQSFQYFSGLSRLNANSIDANGQVPAAGTYYIVASNTGSFNSVSMNGHISASMNPVSSATNIPLTTLVVIGVIAFIVIAVVAVVLAVSRKSGTRQNQAPGQPGQCPRCGQPNWSGAQFCGKCGWKFW